MAPLEWQRIASELDKDYGIIRLRRDLSLSPRTGIQHEFLVLESREWVIVVAVTPRRRLILIQQYRHGVGQVTLEMPGGLVEEGMTPLEAAKAELRQETGFAGGEWVELGRLLPMPALFSNQLHVFLARDVEYVGELDLDEAEDIEVEIVPLVDARALVAEGRIAHAQMVAALMLYEIWAKLDGSAGP